jgi:hypothetical protein
MHNTLLDFGSILDALSHIQSMTDTNVDLIVSADGSTSSSRELMRLVFQDASNHSYYAPANQVAAISSPTQVITTATGSQSATVTSDSQIATVNTRATILIIKG